MLSFRLEAWRLISPQHYRSHIFCEPIFERFSLFGYFGCHHGQKLQMTRWMRLLMVAAYKPYLMWTIGMRIEDSLVSFKSSFTEKTQDNLNLWVTSIDIMLAFALGCVWNGKINQMKLTMMFCNSIMRSLVVMCILTWSCMRFCD